MSTKIIMVRHGYSVANNLKFFTGQSDVELNDIGKRQAELCGEFFRESPSHSANGEAQMKRICDMEIPTPDAIYSSDLCRAYKTALEIGKALEMKVEKREELREIYAGEWEMMPFTEIDEKYRDDYAVWKNDIGRAVCTDGESVASLAQRTESAVRSIAQRHDGGCVVIVTHATPIRVICALAKGFDTKDMAKVPWVSNASISMFEYDGSFKEIGVNLVAHLGELKTDLPRGV